MSLNWFKLSSPASFYPVAGTLIPWFAWGAAILAAIGLWLGFGVAPTDFQQGEVYRVIFIHVPTAWMSMFLYFVMAFWGALTLVFNTRLSAMMARAIAPTGAMFTFIALWTGALWGRPTWGTYWVWDARITSELVLLFLYLGIISLRQGLRRPAPRRSRLCGAVDRRRGEHADHLLLGEVVEHAAPGRVRQVDRIVDGDHDARRHAGDELRVLVLLDRGDAGARARDRPRAGARRRRVGALPDVRGAAGALR